MSEIRETDNCQMAVLITLVSWKLYYLPRQSTAVLFSHSQLTTMFDLLDVTNIQIIVSSVRKSYTYMQGCTDFPDSRRHFKIPGAKRGTWKKFNTEDPQIFGTTVKNFVATVTWRPGFLHLLISNSVWKQNYTLFTMRALFNRAVQCIFTMVDTEQPRFYTGLWDF